MVGHTDSRRQTPGHSAWPSWPVAGVWLCRPWHSTAATSDRPCVWHMCWGWIQAFFTNRTQHVSFHGQLSSKQSLLFGVPQGSVLGPLPYLLYTAELEQLDLTSWSARRRKPVYISAPVSDERGSRSQLCCLRPWHQWVDESQQTAAEPD